MALLVLREVEALRRWASELVLCGRLRLFRRGRSLEEEPTLSPEEQKAQKEQEAIDRAKVSRDRAEVS